MSLQDQRVVVMGATGGVGGYAVQMARSRGAHVIATVRGDADEARRLGAEEVYDTKAVDVIDALHAAHPDGVDAVLDLVNGTDAIGRDAEILKSGGSLVSTIHAADEGWFAGRKITAHNIAAKLESLVIAARVEPRCAHARGRHDHRARPHRPLNWRMRDRVLEKLRNGGLRGKAVIHV